MLANWHKNSISLLLILSISLIHLNTALFTHSHKLENGETVIHAHPYKQSEGSESQHSHSHTKEELVYIDNLNKIFFLIIFVIIVASPIFGRESLELITYSFKKPVRNTFSNRAPPFMV